MVIASILVQTWRLTAMCDRVALKSPCIHVCVWISGRLIDAIVDAKIRLSRRR